MFSFGDSFKNISTDKKDIPAAAGHKFVIVHSEFTTSKAGNPMLRVDADIAEGDFAGFFADHPKRLYITMKDEKGERRVKRTIEDIAKQNTGIFPEDDLWASGEFDETRLIGCVSWGILGWDDEGYLDLKTLCDEEYALKAEEKPRPAKKEVSFNTGEKTTAERKSMFSKK